MGIRGREFTTLSSRFLERTLKWTQERTLELIADRHSGGPRRGVMTAASRWSVFFLLSFRFRRFTSRRYTETAVVNNRHQIGYALPWANEFARPTRALPFRSRRR
jgi:hypothetical protein